MSPKILSVLYLRKIKQDLDKIVFTNEVKMTKQEFYFPKWQCSECGTINNGAAKNCKNCFAERS